MRPRRSAMAALLVLCVGPVAAADRSPRTLAIDPKASVLTFTIKRPGETIEGTAHTFTGEVVLDPGDLSAASSVVLRVVASSLETGNGMRDRKMRGSHLEVERFPEIAFRSTSIQVGSEREAASPSPSPGGEPGRVLQRKAIVEGVLSLHGVDRTIMVPASIRYDNGTLTAEGTVDLTYSDFSIAIPRFLWLVMDDEIKVRFRFVASAAR
ncbi:MAG TPA: YceI family protein [Candidatus Polarisedimenticolia bacterium]|nr:YceI family protein [Candidatus Polarisedimenticolia bacterium]